jgi:glycerate kinase
MGKGPGLVFELAKKYKKKIYVIAGRVDPSHMKDISYISLSELAPSQDAAFTQPIHWLQEAASELAVILDV